MEKIINSTAYGIIGLSKYTKQVLRSMRWIATHTNRKGLTALDLVTEYEEINGFKYSSESKELLARFYDETYGGKDNGKQD